MTLLERYIFRRAFYYSLSSFLSLVVIVWVVQALQRIDIVRTSVSAAGNIFWIAFMLIPDLAAGVLPFAILIGSVQALNALNADSERAVIAASGAARWVVIKPIVLLGLLASATILFNSHFLGPAAQRAFHNGLRAINADAITLFLQPGRFEQVQSGLVMSIGEARGSTVESLFLSDRRDPTVDLTYFAKEARIIQRDDQSYLVLYDGQLHRKTASDGAVSIIQFQTYAFDLANLKPNSGDDWIRTSERSTSELLNPDPSDTLFQKKPSSFVKEISQRFSDWLYAIAFSLWALVVASHPRTNRQGPGPAMALGLTGALVLKALGFVAASLVEDDLRFQYLAYALPIAAIVFDLGLLVLNVDVTRLAAVRYVSERARRGTAVLRRLFPLPSLQGGRP